MFLIYTASRGAPLIRGEFLVRAWRLFQCGYPILRHSLEDGTYARPGAFTGNTIFTDFHPKVTGCHVTKWGPSAQPSALWD